MPYTGILGYGGMLGALNDPNSGNAANIYIYGSGGMDRPNIVRDSSGNFYVVAIASEQHYGGEGGQNSDGDIILIKFNSTFQIQWQTLIGTASNGSNFSGNDGAGNSGGGKPGIATDGTSVWVGFQERTGPYTYRIHVAKFATSNGANTWKKMIENADDDLLFGGLDIDSSGNSYVTFWGTGTNGDDSHIVKLNSSGTTQWQRAFGGSQQDEVYNSITDSSGNTYTVGLHNYPSASNPVYDWSIGIAKYNSSGTQQWYRAFGDSNYSGSGSSNPIDTGYAIALDDAESNIVVTGHTTGHRIIVAKYNTSGTIQWYKAYKNQEYPNSGSDTGRSVSIDPDGNVFVTAMTNRFYRSAISSIGIILKFNSSGTLQFQNYMYWGFGPGADNENFWSSLISDNKLYIAGIVGGHLYIAKLPLNENALGINYIPANTNSDLLHFSLDYFGLQRPITSGTWNGWYIGNNGSDQYDPSTQNYSGSNSLVWKKYEIDSTTKTDRAANQSGSGYTPTLTVSISSAVVNSVDQGEHTSDIMFNLDARNNSSWPGSGTTWSDLSANSRNFTLSGATNGTQAVIFDGTNDFGTLSHDTWMPNNFDNWAIEMYADDIILPGPNQFNAVLSKAVTTSNNDGVQFAVGFYATPSPNVTYKMVAVANSTGSNNIGTWNTTPLTFDISHLASSLQNGFNQFVWSFEGNNGFSDIGKMYFYINGEEVATFEDSSNKHQFGNQNSSADLRLADSLGSTFSDHHLNAKIRLVRMYSKDLGLRVVNMNYQNCIKQTTMHQHTLR